MVADPSWRSAAAPGRDPGRDQGFPRPPGGEVFQQAVFEWAPSGHCRDATREAYDGWTRGSLRDQGVVTIESTDMPVFFRAICRS